MADFALLLEAERRGILPEDKKALLAEARNRGLVPPAEGAEAPPADEPREPGSFEYLFNRIKKGFAGTIDLVRQNPGKFLPPVIQPHLGRLVDEGARRFGPQTTTRDMVGFDPNMKTENIGLRYAGGVAEMLGAGGPLMFSRSAALPILTSSVGAGLGMEAGGDTAEGLGLSRESGEAVGALAGGVGSSLLPNVATGGVGALRRRFSPAAQRDMAASTAGKEIAEQLDAYPPARANIQRSLEISDEIPGFAPGLPARSGAPGLIAEERVLVGQNPRTLNKAVERVEANERAVMDFVETKFPQGAADAATQVRKLGQMHAARLESIRTQIDDKLDDAVRVFESNPSNFENGERLRTLFFKQKQVYAGIRSQKYQDVYKAADEAGVRAQIDDVVDYADEVLKSEYLAYQQSEIPAVFRQIGKKKPAADAPEAPGGDVSFAELHSLYKRANADLAALRGSNRVDRDLQIHLLENLKTKLTDKIKAFEGPEFGDVAAKLKEANRFYAEEYLPRFKQGFGADVAARLPSGEYRTISDHIVDLIARPRNVRGAKDFKLLFDEVPEAHEALKAGYLDKFFKAGAALDKNGRINQKALDSFLRAHGDTLAEFPQIRKDLQQLSLDNAALLERRAAIVAAEKRLAASDLYRLFQGKDPVAVLTEATTNPNAMRVLAFQARHNPEMAKSLARGVADHVTRQADPAAFLASHSDAIRVALAPLGQEHLKNLTTAVEALTINARSIPPHSVMAASVTPDAIAAKLGSSPRAMISHFLNWQRGRTGATQEGAAFVGRWFDKLRRDHKAVAMEAVFYDRNTARALANLVKDPTSEKARLDFVTQMTALGVRAEVAGQE